MIGRKLIAAAVAWGLLGASPALAEELGRTDFEEALRVKVAAEDLRELNHVIELLESALDKGLEVENSDFAEQMLGESLLERAEQLQSVLAHVPVDELTDARMEQVRKMAESDLRRVMTYDDPPPQALAMLAKLLAMPSGDPQEARRLLDRLMSHPQVENLLPPERAEAFALRASLQKRPERAQADLDAAVALTPNSVAVRMARASFLHEHGKHAEALADLKTLLETHPETPAAYLLQSQVYRDQQQWEEAQQALAKASELAPASSAPIQARGELYRQRNDLLAAIEQFSKVLEMEPGNLLALVHRAEAYLANRQFNEALADAETILQMQPGLVVAHALRAQALANVDRLPEAIAEMEQLAAAVPAENDYKMQLALYYLVAQQPRKAIEAYGAVVKADEKDFFALRGRGDAYLSIGDHAAAVADFDRAIALRPDDPALLNNFAWVLATSPDDVVRDGKRAVELATKACEITEYKKPHILSTLAAAYAEAGDFAEARKRSQQAVDTRDPDDSDEEAAQMSEQLQKELASYQQDKPWRERQTTVDKSEPATKDEAAVEQAAANDPVVENPSPDESPAGAAPAAADAASRPAPPAEAPPAKETPPQEPAAAGAARG